MIESRVCRWHWNKKEQILSNASRREKGFVHNHHVWSELFIWYKCNNRCWKCLLWHYHNETIFLVLVCANDLHINNYDLYHGELLQYTILMFLQWTHNFLLPLICINTAWNFRADQKALVILKVDSILHELSSLVHCVTWTDCIFKFYFLNPQRQRNHGLSAKHIFF